MENSHPTFVHKNAHASYNTTTKHTNSNAYKNKGFRGKAIGIAKAALMVIPNIGMNIGCGIIKSLEITIIGPSQAFSNLGKKLGAPGSKLSTLGTCAGIFAGSIVTLIVAVPSLLVGTVFGLSRMVYKFPKTMQTCASDGFWEAAGQTIKFYHIGHIIKTLTSHDKQFPLNDNTDHHDNTINYI